MDDQHDNLQDWPSGQVDPLYPPPGTFDLIRRRAQRLKHRKLAVTAGSAAVIVAARPGPSWPSCSCPPRPPRPFIAMFSMTLRPLRPRRSDRGTSDEPEHAGTAGPGLD